MKKMMYVHQADQLGERTIGQFCQTLGLGQVQQVRVKATQWMTWTGRFDKGPAWDITDFSQLGATRDAFEGNGIEFYPWGCPMGLDEFGNTAVNAAGVEAEAQRFAAIANLCGKVDLDIEPYSDFWPAIANGDYRAVVPFFSRLRELAPRAEIVVDLPYRAGISVEDRLMSPVVELASPYVDAFYLQSYFGIDQARDAEARAKTHTAKPVHHIASTNELPVMLNWLADGGADQVAVWVAPYMNSTLYAELLKYPTDTAHTGPQIAWQEPGFAELFLEHGVTTMGKPTDIPYADDFGNVFQESADGCAMWLKQYNQSFWLPKPDGLAPGIQATRRAAVQSPAVAPIDIGAAAPAGVPAAMSA